MVQFTRFATGAASNGAQTRSAASAFTGGGPAYTLRLDGLDAAARKIAAPKANCILAHTEHLGDPRAGPAIERQQYGARPIRLAAITRNRQNFERRPLLVTRLNRRFARHVPPPRNQYEDAITVEIRWSSSRSLLRLGACPDSCPGGDNVGSADLSGSPRELCEVMGHAKHGPFGAYILYTAQQKLAETSRVTN